MITVGYYREPANTEKRAMTRLGKRTDWLVLLVRDRSGAQTVNKVSVRLYALAYLVTVIVIRNVVAALSLNVNTKVV